MMHPSAYSSRVTREPIVPVRTQRSTHYVQGHVITINDATKTTDLVNEHICTELARQQTSRRVVSYAS